MNKFIIDVKTTAKAKTIRRLKALVSTKEVTDGGEYHQDRSYSQIHVTSTLTNKLLDDYLYKNNFDYVGVVDVE